MEGDARFRLVGGCPLAFRPERICQYVAALQNYSTQLANETIRKVC